MPLTPLLARVDRRAARDVLKVAGELRPNEYEYTSQRNDYEEGSLSELQRFSTLLAH
jgi:hypothetical protein